MRFAICLDEAETAEHERRQRADDPDPDPVARELAQSITLDDRVLYGGAFSAFVEVRPVVVDLIDCNGRYLYTLVGEPR